MYDSDIGSCSQYLVHLLICQNYHLQMVLTCVIILNTALHYSDENRKLTELKELVFKSEIIAYFLTSCPVYQLPISQPNCSLAHGSRGFKSYCNASDWSETDYTTFHFTPHE
jgi:hypothetical protein